MADVSGEKKPFLCDFIAPARSALRKKKFVSCTLFTLVLLHSQILFYDPFWIYVQPFLADFFLLSLSFFYDIWKNKIKIDTRIQNKIQIYNFLCKIIANRSIN